MSVDVFVMGTVMFSSGLNVSVGNCVVVSVYVFVGGTVMLSSGLNAQWWIVLECRRLCLLLVMWLYICLILSADRKVAIAFAHKGSL